VLNPSGNVVFKQTVLAKENFSILFEDIQLEKRRGGVINTNNQINKAIWKVQSVIQLCGLL
jgi:hypothetical protein